MPGIVGKSLGAERRCLDDGTLDEKLDDRKRSGLDLIGELFFDKIEFDGLGTVAGCFLLLLFAAAAVFLSRSAMAKDGEVGGESQQ